MKITNIFCAFAFAVFLFSCKKDDAKPAAPTTGGLIIKVTLKKDNNQIEVGSNIEIRLATSESNLTNDVGVTKKVTNANGVADFGQLTPGTYFYMAAESDTYESETKEVKVVAGTVLTKEYEIQLIADDGDTDDEDTEDEDTDDEDTDD